MNVPEKANIFGISTDLSFLNDRPNNRVNHKQENEKKDIQENGKYNKNEINSNYYLDSEKFDIINDILKGNNSNEEKSVLIRDLDEDYNKNSKINENVKTECPNKNINKNKYISYNISNNSTKRKTEELPLKKGEEKLNQNYNNKNKYFDNRFNLIKKEDDILNNFLFNNYSDKQQSSYSDDNLLKTNFPYNNIFNYNINYGYISPTNLNFNKDEGSLCNTGDDNNPFQILNSIFSNVFIFNIENYI